ncbi:MAG: hypothetical protein KDD46_00575 [Bdellovibrionales bacterium]|nr:hypothetical protein [Bdellovibrionales bacterium]
MKVFKDICVVGTELPALIAGRILQRKGARVHYFEHATYTQFDPTICEFLSGIFIKPLMQRLGFHPHEIQQMLPLDVPAQFICKNKRINFFKDSSKLKKELLREEVDGEIYTMLHRDLEKSYKVFFQIYQREIQLFEKNFLFQKDLESKLKNKTSIQMLKMFPLDQMMAFYNLKPGYAHFIKSLELVFSYYLSEYSNHSRFTHLTHLLQDYGYYSILGQYGLKQKLKSHLKEKGAVFDTFSSIEKIHRSGNKIHRIHFQGSSTQDIEFSKLVINGSANGFIAYQPEDKKIQSLAHEPHLYKTGKRLYFLYKIHKSYLPLGIRTQGVVFPKNIEIDDTEKRKFPRVIRYMLHLPNQQATDYKTYLNRLEKDYALLAITYFVSNDFALNEQKIKHEIFHTMSRFIPFFIEKNVSLIQSYVPTEKPMPGDLRQGFIYASRKNENIGLAGNPIETDFKNVWNCNESNFPTIGLDGQILTGDQLAQMLS